MTSQIRTTAGALTICAALIATACGGGSSDGNPPAATDDTGDTPVTTVAPADSAPIEPTANDDEANDDAANEDVDRGDTPWEGADFRSLADERMEELGATFGLDATPESVAPIFALPDDFPYPAGTVLGIFHEYDVDVRTTDAVDITEERIVAIDGAGDAAALDDLQEVVGAGTVSRWQGASSQRTDTNLDLYTAPDLEGSDRKDRLVVRGNPAPETGAAYLQVHLEQYPTEIPSPTWQAGLPVLDGGQLIRVQEGRGIVESFGRLAEDGHIELTHLYPLERFDELEALFASGIFESAGFTYEDTPFSNFDIRIDVSNGEWEGIVAVGGISVDGEDIGHTLTWSLTRPGRIDAPVPPTTESAPADTPVEAPRPEIDSGVESSPDTPAPLAGATFQWDDRNVQWDMVLHGIVEAETTFSTDVGRCVHVVAVATPTYIEDGFSTGDADLPKIGLLAGGEYVTSGTKCATVDLEAAGYNEFEVTGSILGAPSNFATSFFLEGDSPATIDAVVLGDEDDPAEMGLDDDENSYFTADVIGEIPARAQAPADLALPASNPLVGAATTIGVGRDEWETVFHGIFEVAPRDSSTNPNDGVGRCLIVVGESTSSRLNAGYITDDPPKMNLIAGGQLINGFGFCDDEPITDAGYTSHGRNGYTQGTTISFMESFLVPPGLADQVTTLVLDEPDDERQFFSADLIETLPPAVGVSDAGQLPDSEGPMNAGAITWTNQRGDVIDWSIEMSGLVPLGEGRNGTTCYAVVGSMTPDVDVENGFWIPDFSLLAQGAEFAAVGTQCDVEPLEALGYVPTSDAQVSAGTTVTFFEAIPVRNEPARELDLLIVGDASVDLQSQAYDIVLIDAAPAP